VAPERTQARHPLFQVVLTLQNAPQATLDLPGIAIRQFSVTTNQSQFDLALNLSERFDQAGAPAGIESMWEYSSDLFDRDSIVRIAWNFERLLRQAIANPLANLRDIEFSGEADQKLSLERTSAATLDQRPSTTLSVGKIGHRTSASVSSRPPRTDQEKTLCRLFAELLSLKEVGANENFFHLGGDSILSIQLISRARKAGLVLAPRDIFQHQTPEALAIIAKPALQAESLPSLSDETGVVLLATPIIQALFEQGGRFKRFHQSLLLQVPVDIREDHLVTLLQLLLDSHAALRLRLQSDRNLYIPPRGSVRAQDCLTVVDAGSGTGSGKAIAREAESHLDPEAGRMIHAVWFHQDHRLLILIHHLAVDGISWRIVLADLASGWKAIVRDEIPALEPEGTPFRRWAEYLFQRARHPEIYSQLSYWKRALAGGQVVAGAALDPSRDAIATSGNLRLTLPVGLTATLLTDVSAAFHAQINDVLLTALAIATMKWRCSYGLAAGNTITIDLEGHGREPMESGLDLSRTVGWFTTVFPVCLDLKNIDLDDAFVGSGVIGRALKQIKDQLRAVPSRGLDYGILRYLSDESGAQLAALAGPQISFNYLGRFTTQEGVDWLPIGADAGFSGGADPEMPLLHLLEIDAVASDGPDGPQLTAYFSWAKNHLDESSVQKLAWYWQSCLEALVAHSRERGAGGHSTSDFPLVPLSLEQIERIEAAYPAIGNVLPLSPLQQGLLFHSLYVTSNDVYTVQTSLEITGRLSTERLRQAIEAVLHRYPNLEISVYHEGLEQPVQVVSPNVVLPWREIDLSMIDGQEQRTCRCSEILSDERSEPFTFSKGPLLRLILVRLGPERHVLAFTNHHLIMDGWSTPLFFGEILELYSNRVDLSVLPPACSYTDYLRWLTAQDRSAALVLWKNYLNGVESPTLIAPPLADKEETQLPDSRQHDLSQEQTDLLYSMARSRSLTLNTVLQGLWAVLLARLTNQDDVLFGITVSGRSPEVQGIEQMVGLFINTVPLRVRLNAGQLFSDVLVQIQAGQSQMLNTYHLGLHDIQREAGFERLFDTIFVFENYPLDRSLLTRSFDGIQIGNVKMHDGAHYPLALMIAPVEGCLRVRLDYNPALFTGEQTARIAKGFLELLGCAAVQPDVPWHQLNLLAVGERDRVLKQFNGPLQDLPITTVTQMFEDWAARTPNTIASVQGKASLSYGELNEQANRLAHCLVAKGIGPESLVGVALERSLEMVVAIIAIWKAGAGYLPLDPEYPRIRLEYMLKDARPSLVLIKSHLRSNMTGSGIELIDVDDAEFLGSVEKMSGHNLAVSDRKTSLLSKNPAYVIYTSGSTGTPKGVVVTHEGVPALAASQADWLKLNANSRILQFASLNFDASFWEFLMTFSAGATLVLLEPERKDAALYETLVSQQVTHALLPIPVLKTLEEFETLPLECLMNGGEVLSGDLVSRWSHGLRMINAYGPTESTVCATISKSLQGPDKPSIGSAIINTRLYVLDNHLELAPIGVAGELYIAGPGLARGYLNRFGLTADRFVADPFAIQPGGRMYRTGDVVRWNDDGTLEFVGRSDEQVKVRGFRIELGEIEAGLRDLPGIADAVVTIRKEDRSGKQIVAYVVPKNGSLPDAATLRRELSARLPSYMLPALYMPLEDLPLTPNGKVDRRALPVPVKHEHTFRAPESPEEIALCVMFAKVLDVEQIKVEDDFFALGGDSLSAMRLVGRIGTAFGVEISLREFYSASMVADLATLVQAKLFTVGSGVTNGTSFGGELYEEEEI
jgi:amino acid adenylation domain-containing protein/non-ribosomal peptide synthase protein (TIGR01720 family)